MRGIRPSIYAPAFRAERSCYLVSDSTFYLDRPSFSGGTTLKQSQLCESAPSFLPSPLDPRIRALRADIMNTCMWNPSPQKLRTNPSTEETYTSESKHQELLAEDRSKILSLSILSAHIKEIYSKSKMYHLPSFAAALGQPWPVGRLELAASGLVLQAELEEYWRSPK